VLDHSAIHRPCSHLHSRGGVGTASHCSGPVMLADWLDIVHVCVLQSEVVMEVPARIGDYTDFYTSKHHAFNCGSMFRDPAAALAPNWYGRPHTVLTPVVPGDICM